MKEKYYRKNSVIFNEKHEIVFNGKGSINKAKQEAHRLQIANDGALGRGAVRIIQ